MIDWVGFPGIDVENGKGHFATLEREGSREGSGKEGGSGWS
jgi:hypothetical protein